MKDLYAIASTDEFVNAWKTVIEKPISLREFSQLPMPKDCSAEDLWRCFAIQRRLEGITFSIKPWFRSDQDVSWASLTKQTEAELLQIAELAGPGSHLNSAVETASVRMTLMQLIVKELIPTCHFDGLSVTEKQIERIFLNREMADPLNPEEKALEGFTRAFFGADEYVARPLSISTVDLIHEDIVRDCGELVDLDSRSSLHASIEWSERVNDVDFAERMLQASLREARSATTTTDVIIAFHQLSSTMWDLNCFPSLKSLTELVLRRVFFTKVGMPVLAFIPFRHLAGSSSNRYFADFVEEIRHLQTKIGTEEGLDCTIHLAGTVSTLLEGLRIVTERVQQAEEQSALNEQELKHAEGLNRRQKDFIAILQRNPATTIRFREYAALFGVVRSTARADLLDLANKGYLTRYTEGRATTFAAGGKALSFAGARHA
jgi:hypothetical protein